MARLDIALKGLRFFSRIGVVRQERVVGNDFTVDVNVGYDASLFEDGCLESTVPYDKLYEIVEAEMAKETLLLESVAKNIADAIGTGDGVLDVKVCITKVAPPIPGMSGSASVTYSTTG